MQKVYYLATCSTCLRILKELNLPSNFEQQDIKTQKITIIQLEEIAALAGSFEALFSRKAMKFTAMGLKDKALTEAEYKSLILEEYTFLKRPVIIINSQIFIGNSKSTIDDVKIALTK